jgi:hypothetical protein
MVGFDPARSATRTGALRVRFRLDMNHAKQLIRPFATVVRPMQKGLAFRSKGSTGIVVRRGANARMTQPPHRH